MTAARRLVRGAVLSAIVVGAAWLALGVSPLKAIEFVAALVALTYVVVSGVQVHVVTYVLHRHESDDDPDDGEEDEDEGEDEGEDAPSLPHPPAPGDRPVPN